MVLTVTKNGRWRLVGTPNEFADVIGYHRDVDYTVLLEGIANVMEGTSARFKDHRGWWELRGSRSDLAEILGVPDVKTVTDTLEAFGGIHPNVRVLSS